MESQKWVAIGTEATARFQDVTLQRVRGALQGKEWSFTPNGREPYKVLVPCDVTEQVSSRVIGSAFSQVKKLCLSDHLFLVQLKEGASEQMVSLFCKGAIGFSQVVLRMLSWFQDKKECIDVLHRKGLVQRQLRDSPLLSLWKLCGNHAVSWYSGRSPQFD